ncbi:enoyl-CoA hydratase [Comamonas serinivorans]|uniref:Enoyl-CoA hydratase n=1 Tax=Comamonas serinivorans TaxID=1082851 RepID=A0A1Y0ER77_9BURK|nr:crotonase/enoyl-CoA hydratase family protein [Comamonas serinivorans]ARU06008.1 enoyl-CoA hydratase [Comamonas serinivorans]
MTATSAPDTRPPVATERHGHVLVVRLQRPEARNALDLATARGIHAAMDELDDDDNLFAGILTGSGGNFCAGADLKAVARGERPTTERGAAGLMAKPARKPLIAAVEGWALGGGFELCLACDLVVAARDARFGLPEVKRNLVAAWGGLFRLPKRLPQGLAMELALLGEPRSAEFFVPHGLVNRVTEPGQALQGALQLAGQMLANGPTALAATVQIMRNAHNWSEAEAWREQEPFVMAARQAEDCQEGLAAFMEKRPPVWKGR